jgi:dihydrofolate reductase
LLVSSLEQSLTRIAERNATASSSSSYDALVPIHRAFIIGGATIYKQSLALPNLERILLTRVLEPSFDECDVFLPEFRSGVDRSNVQNGESERVVRAWNQAPHAELVNWAGWDVPEGKQTEKGVDYEFQMLLSSSSI